LCGHWNRIVHRRDPFSGFLIINKGVMEASGGALRQAMSEGLNRLSAVIDQLRASAHQRLSRVDEDQVRLAVLAPGLYRVQERGVKTGEVLPNLVA
jgi:hypothetical protein